MIIFHREFSEFFFFLFNVFIALTYITHAISCQLLMVCLHQMLIGASEFRILSCIGNCGLHIGPRLFTVISPRFSLLLPVRARFTIFNLPTPELKDLINKSMVSRAIEQAEFPPVKNPVGGIVPMEDGKFLVVHDVNLLKGTALVHIYGADGKYLGQFGHTNFGMLRMIFKNGFAYTLEITEDEENELVRYKYELVEKS